MHRDLPLAFDIPARRAPALPASDGRSRLLARFHPRLAAAWQQDRQMLRQVRGAALVPIGLAVLAFVVFGVLRLGINYIYSESLPFLLIAVIVGCLSPIVGVALVIGIGLADLVWTIPGLIVFFGSPAWAGDALGPIRILTAIAGRLVAYAMLWLLIVEVPLIARQAVTSPLTVRLRSRIGAWADSLAAGVTGAVLAFVWMSAFPLAIRAPFVWGFDGDAPVEAVAAVQYSGWPIVVVAAVTLAASALVYARFRVDAPQPAPTGPPSRFSWLAPRVLGLVFLASMISSFIDLLILLTVLLGSPFVARAAWSQEAIASRMERIPGLLRFVTGFAVTFFISQQIGQAILFEGMNITPFFPVIVAVAIGVVIYDLLFGPPAGLLGDRRPPRVPAAGVAGILVVSGLLFLLMPAVALADDCSDAGDCFPDPIAFAAAAGGAAGGALGSRYKRPMGPPPPPPTPPPDMEHDTFKRRQWEKTKHDYREKWYPDKYQPRGDEFLDHARDMPPIQPGAFATSGTGTRA